MTSGVHLSVRVPWHDAMWSGTVCKDPLGNASCILLKNVGEQRKDDYEVEHAGQSLDQVDISRIACMTERATFLSARGYQLTKEHPYRFNHALSGLLEPTTVALPAYSVHATPYFWLHRDNVPTVLRDVDVDYSDQREQLVDSTLNFKPGWVLHGDNQTALIERFFQDVTPHTSLVFFYAKHTPFDDRGDGQRLLVGAARVTDVRLPGPWRTSGQTPFANHMWETIVNHSLRPDGLDGILLPLDRLAALDVDGEDISAALAWAPEYDGREFSYVTEHVSDDTAIAALERLFAAAQRCVEVGLDVPLASLDWISQRIGELWTMRGPAPGLGGVLSTMGVRYGAMVARQIERHTPEGVDPWDTMVNLLENPRTGRDVMAGAITVTPRKVWASYSDVQRRALKLLSRFQLTPDHVEALFTGDTEVELTLDELLDDPYHAYTCMVGGWAEVPFDVVDRGCFPRAALRSAFPLEDPSTMDDNLDARRVQALLVSVLEAAADEGHTVMPLDRILAAVAERQLVEPCPVSEQILRALDLHPTVLDHDPESPYWPPLVGVTLADGKPAFKLARMEATAEIIRTWIGNQDALPRHAVPEDLPAILAWALAERRPHDEADSPEEARARIEKLAALAELFAAPLSILNGRAGTGKTTLIKALVNHPEVRDRGVLLLAPTGKARVQLQTKVGLPALTLAQFLSRYGRYNAETGTYLVDPDNPKAPRVDTVVVDESSMLTEEQLGALLDALMAPRRLILVGDPRQLPPIGAGRPFVDLVTRSLRENTVPEFPRVTTGYAELQVLRRQADPARDDLTPATRSSGDEISEEANRVRDDLMLAAWFSGDELPEGADEVWQRLRAGTTMANLAAIRWASTRPDGVVEPALATELGVTGADAASRFERSYGGQANGIWVNFPTGSDGAGAHSEDWQILSPVRGHAWGTAEINRHLKRKYRDHALRRALKPSRERTVPKPLGAEQIVVGDKVLNNRNKRLTSYPSTGLSYVANGEIGVVVGQIGKKGTRPAWTNVEFSSQVGTTYGYRGSNEDDPDLELGWAITIHKSQGSEFGTVFVVLPGSTRRVSREMLYTALTRQKDRVVLLHERPIDELLELTRSASSETARRLTDLFAPPLPRDVRLPNGASGGVVDANLIHVTLGGVHVRSKNEVIIAGILDELLPGSWSYEQPLTIDGWTRYPDFTAVRSDGRVVYWEHLGMLDSPDYQKAWERKLAWYRRGGVLPHDEGGGPQGTLMWTDDLGGVDAKAWAELARHVMGPAAPGTASTSRKATKGARRAR